MGELIEKTAIWATAASTITASAGGIGTYLGFTTSGIAATSWAALAQASTGMIA
jgi:hypothetical protein